MLAITLFVAVLCTCHAAPLANLHLCEDLQKLDCSVNYIQTEADERVCGTDNITYNNLCFYSQARCTNTHMHVAKIGACDGSVSVTVTTTRPVLASSSSSSGTVMTTSGASNVMTTTMAVSTTVDHLLQVFCASKDTLTCNTDLDPICGSDKNFYLNKCEFSKATCDDPSITVQDISFCTGR